MYVRVYSYTEIRSEVVEHCLGAREDALQTRLSAHVLTRVREQHRHVEADLVHRTVEALGEPAPEKKQGISKKSLF